MMTLQEYNIRVKMKTVGAVVFICLLLLIAGVESNPGPDDKLVFRCLYLLVEVGTKLLRKVFDDIVSNDFGQYLQTYPQFANQLTFLINKDIITDDQKKYLPPLDNTPDSANFDITLLTCLLRNICGLKTHKDIVWIYPGKGDMSLEAEITRLKECRNELQHMSTVYISEAEFNQKWNKIRDLLHRLNLKGIKVKCLIPDLTELIEDARKKPLDDQLKRENEITLRQWHEADLLFEKGIVDLKIGQSEIKEGQCKLKEVQSELKVGQTELKAGQSKIREGQSEIKAGQSELKDGQNEIREGQSEIKAGQSELKDGQSEIKEGQSEIKVGQSELKDGQSEIKERQDEIKDVLRDLPEIKQSLKSVEKQLQDVQEIEAQNKRRIDNVEQSYSSNKGVKGYSNNDVKECLRKSYETNFPTLCVTPLYCEDDCMEMFKIYKQPKMKHVPYHRSRQEEGNYNISSYEQIFCKENTVFRNIFVTGNAGMGKTSFGQFMSFLWCKALVGEIVGNKIVQKNARFMTKFDFVYYISLKETNREDVVSMIIDKYFYTSSRDKLEETIKTIEDILQTKDCLVILDGVDEWTPANNGNRSPLLPRKVRSDKCIYLTTTRPYKIESVRLSEVDIDHQVEITGFNFTEYIRDVIGYINKSQQTNKDPDDFLRQIRKCGMYDQLSIPILTSQLIFIWFNYEMKNMSKAMIYGSILEMLFERALKREITFPPIESADVHFPEFFSSFTSLHKYVDTLKKVCLLSFLLLFDPDNETPSLVFTEQQLELKPYFITKGEVNFLCQLGILSKNKMIASFGAKKQTLSFLHTSYLEFLAALYVSLYDKTSLFIETVGRKMSFINDIGKYENFLTLMSGISSHMITSLFDYIHSEENHQIDCYRDRLIRTWLGRNYTNVFFEMEQKNVLLQDVALSCWKEISLSSNSHKFLKLEDFVIGKDVDKHLNALLVLNKTNVKLLFTRQYQDEFTEVTGLQYLWYTGDWSVPGPDKLIYLMLQNISTLHYVGFMKCTFTQELPWRRLTYLTSIALSGVIAKHTICQDIIDYISGNDLLEHICLFRLICSEHIEKDAYCRMTLNLSDHSKLHTLTVCTRFLSCIGLNTSSLKSLCHECSYDETIFPSSLSIVNMIKESKLETLTLTCSNVEVWKMVTDSIRSLTHITHLQLRLSSIPDNLQLQFHPDIRCDRVLNIEVNSCRMNSTSFRSFIDSIINLKAMSRVKMDFCSFRDDAGLIDCSSDYFVQYIESVPRLKITEKSWYCIKFETKT